LFITTDQNLRDHQQLSGRRPAVIVLPATRWPEIQRHLGEMASAVDSIEPGQNRELMWARA
jgi:lipid A disaccharide synthetase